MYHVHGGERVEVAGVATGGVDGVDRIATLACVAADESLQWLWRKGAGGDMHD